MQKAIAERVLVVFQRLKELKKVKSVRSFCLNIGYSDASLDSARKGKREVPDHILQNICKTYGVNMQYLIGETDEMFNNIIEVPKTESMIEFYKEQLKEANAEISRLNREIGRLENLLSTHEHRNVKGKSA